MRSFVSLCVALFISAHLLACTSAVISGKATRDGRPILWKQRDTGTLENKLVYHTDGKYVFLGVHNLDDTANAEMFMGSNAAGFSIINTQSYNLDYPKYRGKMDEEGILMKRALAVCATLADFEALLKETAGKRGVEANFGVVDARGGAAYYETDPFTFKKFDANDPMIAPNGYLLRTNFSASGRPEKGQGYIRYQTEVDLFQWGYLGEGLTVEFLLREATTCLRHSLTGIDLEGGVLPESDETACVVNFADFIPRYSTAASMIIQGVAEGEDPSFTTLWTVLGSPLTTPVLPVWVKYAGQVPSQLYAVKGHPSVLNDVSLRLKSRCFPLKVSEGRYYVDLAKVMNRQGTGTLQKLRSVDQSLVVGGRRLLDAMRSGKATASEMARSYQAMMKQITEYYESYGVQF
jgi:hypothetical protein